MASKPHTTPRLLDPNFVRSVTILRRRGFPQLALRLRGGQELVGRQARVLYVDRKRLPGSTGWLVVGVATDQQWAVWWEEPAPPTFREGDVVEITLRDNRPTGRRVPT